MKNLKRNCPPGAGQLAVLLASLAGACGGRTNIDSRGLSGGLLPVTGVVDASGEPDAATDSGRTPPPPAPTASTQVDLLFDIDNSSSMADKQSFLMQSMPNLVGRLIRPNCVSKTGSFYASAISATGPSCASGDSLEFPAVNDLHLAILSSSLGGRGGDICDPVAGGVYGPRTDDHAHLLGNGTAGFPTTVTNMAAPGNFLSWHPAWATSAATVSPIEADVTTLLTDFGDLISEVGENGCGIESQLESWYRFLVQPDPYARIDVSNTVRQASWSDAIDTTILAERAAFLRPTSIVGIIVLTDENDSEIDVRAYEGLGYSFMTTGGNGILCQLPAICTTNPNDPSCNFQQNGAACANGAYTAADSWGLNSNLRHVHMKEKYGLNPQYPVSRYVNGLSAARVPDRSAEYPPGTISYDGTSPNCLNPLFAAALYQPPSGAVSYATAHTALCTPPQPTGPTRTPDMVFYAVIGGVPYQDLHYPTPGANGEIDWSTYQLSDTDWIWMVGRDPEAHNFTGIDPHMVEDYRPRQDASFSMSAGAGSFPPPADVAAGAHATLSPTSATRASGWDPINGREWVTDGLDRSGVPIHQANGLPVDREYACIFPLPAPRNCADPTVAAGGCDCQATGLSHDQTSPACNESVPTQQDYGRAYPTTRELLVARDLARVPGSNPGIVASICPVKPSGSSTDPLFGYNPAMSQLLAGIAKKLGPR